MKLNKDKPENSGIQWFVRRGKAVRGPFPSIVIRRLISTERIVLTDEVSLDREVWRPVGLVHEVLPPNLRQAGDEAGPHEGLPQPFGDKAPFPLVPLLVSIIVVVSVVGLFLVFDQRDAGTPPDCAAKPAPGVNWGSCRLAALAAEQQDLSGLRAANADLRQARLAGAKLRGAQLQYADLSGADLSNTDLGGAGLKGATLRNADLSYADLSGADLSYADLSSANLGHAKWDKALLDHAIWPGNKRCATASVGECR